MNRLLVAVTAALLLQPAFANELLLSAGGGPQPDSDQRNTTYGVDYSFKKFEKSYRQHIHLGVSYTKVTTDADDHRSFHAVSIYPQLNLYPRQQSWGQPYFFVRALGPSYISSNQLGDRHQDNHFAFQAQVGYAARINWRSREDLVLMVSWKHFSNANLFSDNDGIDMPFVVNVGLNF
ncbi:Lipid A 3-O-deacylase (PagL) [Microbulbifer donghaiensis]|uniref:Lipid A 3-O-deacylase (PagL) n=1 Tax=Microbulbifer donghaiensis TaxID=494016 RepID=A0A1M5B1S5_9GAMM|nr:acyloxyacyl hydrolase [Microbulbifer donghaiensis]SHF36425.1 Lipid A 3-O-deacylase (PagL) [Microbulbifer donghaiensis]